MDPGLFALDWNRTGEALTALVLLSMIVERSLSVVFESRFFIRRLMLKRDLNLKELIAVGASAVACYYCKFDLLAIIYNLPQNGPLGYFLTALIVAGGSKGSIKLFRDVLGFKSTAQQELENKNTAGNLGGPLPSVQGIPRPPGV